jgi:hypothetical protein
MERLPLNRIRGLGGKLGARVAACLLEDGRCHSEAAGEGIQQQLLLHPSPPVEVAVGDLARCPSARLRRLFGDKTGQWLHRMAHGLDDDPVKDRRASDSVRSPPLPSSSLLSLSSLLPVHLLLLTSQPHVGCSCLSLPARRPHLANLLAFISLFSFLFLRSHPYYTPLRLCFLSLKGLFLFFLSSSELLLRLLLLFFLLFVLFFLLLPFFSRSCCSSFFFCSLSSSSLSSKCSSTSRFFYLLRVFLCLIIGILHSKQILQRGG